MSVPATLGCILAGGASRRMGEDKAALVLDGRRLIDHVADRLRPQCAEVMVAGPSDSAVLAATGLAVVDDAVAGGLGPIAGIASALRRAVGAFDFVVTTPVDTPFLPTDLVARLHAARGGAAVVHTASGERIHYATALWSTALAADLEAALVHDGLRRVEAFAERHASTRVRWEAGAGDPFENLNTPADRARAEARLLRS